jgi:hypothetical protein
MRLDSTLLDRLLVAFAAISLLAAYLLCLMVVADDLDWRTGRLLARVAVLSGAAALVAAFLRGRIHRQ